MADEAEREVGDFVAESAVLRGIIEGVVEDASTARGHVQTFKAILEEYQEQPQLLDPYLESLVSPLATIVANAASGCTDDELASTMQTCRLIYLLINTRGYKTISRFFPNQARDVQKPLQLLARLEGSETSYAVDEDQQDGSWQTRCVLLLWLSALVILPFDMSSIQVSMQGFQVDTVSSTPPAAQWILALTKGYLMDPGPSRDMAAVLLSKLLVRDDMALCLSDFLAWCWQQLEAQDAADANTRCARLAPLQERNKWILLGFYSRGSCRGQSRP